MISDKISQAQSLVAKVKPEIAENRAVYEAVLQFYSDNALIETSIGDLKTLLQAKSIRTLHATGVSPTECVLDIIDNNPETTAAKGMLRFYTVPQKFDWRDVENAEIEFGNALTLDTYGWQPDFWTVFAKEIYSLTVIAAF